jgi:ATP adenylyltransferase
MLNRYPYTNGHLLIAPYRHTAEIDSLSDEEMLNISTTLRQCCSILRRVMGPDGFNIGINLGKAAGAGVDEHIHIHIVPRWYGDTNFMSVMTDIRIMPENLLDTYDILLPSFMEFSRPLEEP